MFDPRPILGLAQSVAPEHEGFGKAWFDKIFSYTWLRTSAEQYQDFARVIGEALDFTSAQSGIALSAGAREQLMDTWLQLEPWPDVTDAVRRLRVSGVKLAFLSNFTETMLRVNACRAGLESDFVYFSTDLVRAFKPDPRCLSARGRRL